MLLAVILVVNGFWLGPMQIDGGFRPNVRVQYERVSGLDARIIPNRPPSPDSYGEVDLCESIAETHG
jgi:hypothetical protein